MIRVFLCGGLLLAVVALPASRAEAAADCTIRSMLGLAAKGGIDKRLAPLRKQLSRGPFRSFKTIKLLEVKQLRIAQGTSKQTKLPSGKLLKLRFKEKLLLGKRVRLRLHLSITKPKSKKFLPGTLFTIANGGTLLVAGSKYQGGTMIVGVTCRSK